MSWWQTLVVALTTYTITKIIDSILGIIKEKRDFKKSRREKIFTEIEDLKNEVGRYYETATRWRPFDQKLDIYTEQFSKEFDLIGRYNKYPEIAKFARQVIHHCKLVAQDEKEKANVPESKELLHQKFSEFIIACNKFVDNIA
ncbi:MAG: hypothetical protein KC422_05130 [Trueperaceae bacterium]|nr:hypothetical protein [Trueperaceae bacterium]